MKLTIILETEDDDPVATQIEALAAELHRQFTAHSAGPIRFRIATLAGEIVRDDQPAGCHTQRVPGQGSRP